MFQRTISSLIFAAATLGATTAFAGSLTAFGEQVGRGSRRRMLSIEPFDTDQIRSYLVRHYDEDATRAQDRIDAMGQINDLTALSVNPRMLGFIAALDDAQLKAAAARALGRRGRVALHWAQDGALQRSARSGLAALARRPPGHRPRQDSPTAPRSTAPIPSLQRRMPRRR